MVKQRANLILLVLLLALFAGWWGLSYVQQGHHTSNAAASDAPHFSVQEPVVIYSTHSGGDTVFNGAFAAAACLELGTGVLVQSSTDASHVTLNLTATPKACPAHATSTDNSFSVSVQGSAVLDHVRVNDTDVAYTIEKDTK